MCHVLKMCMCIYEMHNTDQRKGYECNNASLKTRRGINKFVINK